ncbi:hypothetical protein Gpo141_00000011 [Globisporangium polare]
MPRKRKVAHAEDGTVATAAKKSNAPPPPLDEGNEMERQLSAHAASAYNDFVRFFQRRASEQIAANRVFIVTHQQFAAARRRSYPMAASLPYHRAMLNISYVETSEPPLAPDRKVKPMAQTTLGNPNENVTLLKKCVVLPRIPATPNSTMWTALSKNYEVEDQPQLKFLPYFGDDDDDDVVSEFYQIKLQGTSAMEVDFTKEMCESVLQQLQSTWELSPGDLDRVARTIQVETEVVVEVHKKMRAAQKRAKKKKRMREAAEVLKLKSDPNPAEPEVSSNGGAPAEPVAESMEHYFELYESAVDSHRTLFCRRCYKYDCDYHGCVDVPKLDVTEQNAVAEKIRKKASAASTGRNCGNQCFLGRMGSSQFSKARAISTAFGWDAQKRIACARAYFICSGNFCDVAKMLGDKTCLEVAEFCDFYEINEMSLAEERKLQWKPRRGGRKKKMTPSISHLQHTHSRLVDGVPTKIEPCAHTGPCDQSCSCIADGLLCSKLCNCVHNSCQIFYHGCRCMKGRCRTKVCPCFAAGRECDLDMCAVCCQEERNENKDDAPSPLSPVENGSAESKPPSASATSCQNRSMTLGKTKHMRVARSTMEDAGWGLFVDEFVAKDEFLIEYIGEMVSHEEAERRGAVYDKLNRSYLFNLDSGTVVDSTRKGNKTRFINHSSTKPNCFAKINNVNSDYRIGLFFDYRYDQEFHNVSLHKQPTVTEWMKEIKDRRKSAAM